MSVYTSNLYGRPLTRGEKMMRGRLDAEGDNQIVFFKHMFADLINAVDELDDDSEDDSEEATRLKEGAIKLLEEASMYVLKRVRKG